VSFRLIYAQTFHEPAVLLRSQGSCLAFLPWPLERTGLQTFVQQDKSVPFPVQGLDPIPTQVSITTGNVHPVGAGEVAQHDFRKRSTVSTVAAFAPE